MSLIYRVNGSIPYDISIIKSIGSTKARYILI